jgi:hypothetical protein
LKGIKNNSKERAEEKWNGLQGRKSVRVKVIEYHFLLV